MSKGNKVITTFNKIIKVMDNKEFDLWVILSLIENMTGSELNQNQLEKLFNAYHDGMDLWKESVGLIIININHFLMK